MNFHEDHDDCITHVYICNDQSENELTYVNMEGYMEKLPLNKKKATLLKTWKKRYFKAFNGHLYYYEVSEWSQPV